MEQSIFTVQEQWSCDNPFNIEVMDYAVMFEDKIIKTFETKPEAQRFADVLNQELNLIAVNRN